MTSAIVGISSVIGIIVYLASVIAWGIRLHDRISKAEKGIMLCALYMDSSNYAEKNSLPERVRNEFPYGKDKVTYLKKLRTCDMTDDLFSSVNVYGRYIHSSRAVISALVLMAIISILLFVLIPIIAVEVGWFGLDTAVKSLSIEKANIIGGVALMSIFILVVSVITTVLAYWLVIRQWLDKYRPVFDRAKVIEDRTGIHDIVGSADHPDLSDVFTSV